MIKVKIKTDQLQALKNNDTARVNILRYILSKIQNQEINKQKELMEEEVVDILRKVAKELKKEVDKLIIQNQVLYDKNPKAIMGICIKALKSKADSSRIIAILNSRNQ